MPRKNPVTVLSPRMQRAYELRRQGLTWEEIAAKLDVRPETARNYVSVAENTTGERLKEFRKQVPETVNPEKTAELVDRAMTERGLDGVKFLEIAAKAGMPQKVAQGLLGRLRSNYAAVIREMKPVKGQELIDALHGKIGGLLAHLDEYAMAQMSGRDLALALGILIEKTQVLGGRPTQIVDWNLNARLQVLMPQFVEEAKRRGITLEAEPVKTVDTVQ